MKHYLLNLIFASSMTLNQQEVQFEQKIQNVFANAHDGIWKTVSEIATLTDISQSDISKILTRSGEFVRSSYRNKDGEPIYTTRSLFRERAPVITKFLGAFKNRID
jgi:hypothetical protein